MGEGSPEGRKREKGGEGPAQAPGKGVGGRAKGRGALSPEAIVEAAIEIADAEGLGAVSIRRVAAALGARAMSLYRHFESKEELLAAMADRVAEEIIVEGPLPNEWRAAMSKIARRLYATLVRHPWLVFVFTQQPRFGPNATRQARQTAEAMERMPGAAKDLWTIPGTINDYVLGHSLRAITVAKPSELVEVIAESDLEDAPELASLPEWLRGRASIERFEAGLAIVLNGVEGEILNAGG